MRLSSLAALPLLALGACASMGRGPPPTSAAEMAQLQSECDSRGGIVVPSGRLTGEPRLDNICRINSSTGPRLSGS